MAKTGFNIKIIRQKILDIIYLKLFLYKWRRKISTVISKPNITHKKKRLIENKINNDILIYFHVITRRYIICIIIPIPVKIIIKIRINDIDFFIQQLHLQQSSSSSSSIYFYNKNFLISEIISN